MNVIRMQSVGNHVPMADDQRQEIRKDGLRGGAILKNETIPQNLWEVFAREDAIGTTDQSGQEAIQLFQVHRMLVSEALEYRAQTIAVLIGQRLFLHGATLPGSTLPQ